MTPRGAPGALGQCERCKTRPGEIHAYWGPMLCRPCARRVAALLDEHDKWPPVPWGDEHEVLTDG